MTDAQPHAAVTLPSNTLLCPALDVNITGPPTIPHCKYFYAIDLAFWQYIQYQCDQKALSCSIKRGIACTTKAVGPTNILPYFRAIHFVASAVTLVPQGTVECGALTVNIRICKTKRSVIGKRSNVLKVSCRKEAIPVLADSVQVEQTGGTEC